MAIQVTCQCGKVLTAKDDFAGKRVKCPGCGGPLLIPQPQAAQPQAIKKKDDGISDLLDSVGMRAGVMRCPGCGAELSEQAVLCVMCGFDLRLGHRLKPRVGSAAELDDEDLGDLPTHGVAQLDEAERRIARDKLEQKNLAKGAPWWMILLAFLGVVGFTVGMVAMPQDLVMRNSGWILVVAGILMSFYFNVRLLIEGFREATFCGIAMLFIPFYQLYFVITRWDRVGGIFIFIMVGGFLQGAGYAALALVPIFENMAKPQEEDYSLRSWQEWQRRPVAVLVISDSRRI